MWSSLLSTLVDLRAGETLGRKQVVGESDISVFVFFAVFLELSARHHHGHGGFGHEVV